LASNTWVQRIGWWTLYGIAFGVIEATVVIYIRKMIGIAPGSGYDAYTGSSYAGFGTGSITAVLRANGLLHAEMAREAATIALLIGAASGACTSFRERVSLFCFTFAVWDLSYYLYLALATGFPRSLGATDIYFLIPVSWVGPVWFPVLIVMPAMIVVSVRAASSCNRIA
jgi:hypothetical protein